MVFSVKRDATTWVTTPISKCSQKNIGKPGMTNLGLEKVNLHWPLILLYLYIGSNRPVWYRLGRPTTRVRIWWQNWIAFDRKPTDWTRNTRTYSSHRSTEEQRLLWNWHFYWDCHIHKFSSCNMICKKECLTGTGMVKTKVAVIIHNQCPQW